MIDPAALAGFAAVTALTSLLPGPNMLFVLGQAAWQKARGGLLALAGMQLGNSMWFVLAGLGLGTLLAASPLAFRLLTLGGAAYLAWLGLQAWLHSDATGTDNAARTPRRASRRPFRDGIVIALSNPKSLVYVAALLPPFVDARAAIAPQLLLLAVVAILIDVAIGFVYIGAGSRLALAMTRPALRQGIERGVGTLYFAIAAAVVWSVAR